MFEDRTASAILADLLGSETLTAYDTREGSVIYNALAPLAYDLADMYTALDAALNETFPDTCSVKNLNRRADALGIPEQIPASKTVLRCTVTFASGVTEVPAGAVFSYDGLMYDFTETSTEHNNVISVTAQEPDSAYNIAVDSHLVYERTDGAVTDCVVTATITIGNAGETIDEFRQRYIDAVKGAAFDGNIAEYREIVEDATNRTATAIVTYKDKVVNEGSPVVLMRVPKLIIIGTDGKEAPAEVTVDDIGAAIIAKADLRGQYAIVLIASVATFNIEATVTVDSDAGYTASMIQDAATAAFEELYKRKLGEAEATSDARYNLADVQRIVYSLDGVTAVTSITGADSGHALFTSTSSAATVYKPAIRITEGSS